jgi:hypothetical protein
MIPQKRTQPLRLLAALLVCLSFAEAALGQAAVPVAPARGAAWQPVAESAANLPADVQLINADTNPTLRFPISHSIFRSTGFVAFKLSNSYGWLEITRGSVRYAVVRQTGTFKDNDEGFDIAQAEIIDLRIENNVVQFRVHKTRHFIGYVGAQVLGGAAPPPSAANSSMQAYASYTAAILEALRNFDGVVAEVKLKQQAAAPPAVTAQPAVTPPPEPKTLIPPSPPAVVLVSPSGAGENQTVQVNESPLTIRGVAMDNSGFPTVTINGAPAMLRPKSTQAAEFWSDPITLKPGDNTFEIVATNSAQAKSKFSFVAHFTPKAAPPNPRALGKQDIISLLQGGVASARVAEIIKERGLKFSPTADDLNDIRGEGGNDELIQAIQQAAAPAK